MTPTKKAAADDGVDALSYAEASAELDGVIEEFETGVIDVDRLVERLERATAIVDELDRRLRRTRMQVEELVPRLESIGRDDAGEGEDLEIVEVDLVEDDGDGAAPLF
jgi:exodeoxyribonuclease VII small subunit